ncbi:MAG: TetR/AcrR family transcriptional regulator [Pseudomonadales bacterium]|nr:TetR/AcrR family transcriptional regulator [Pseudomonadales bacterium]
MNRADNIAAGASGRQQRALDTRDRLMRAAEKLVAERGLENVTLRAITTAAEQKNESALQYHFGGRDGLIEAIHHARNAQVQEKRAEMLDALVATQTAPTLRHICKLMVEPPFLLARKDPGFRHYVKGFGREIAITDGAPTDYLMGRHRYGTRETRRLLRETLSFLDDEIFQYRFNTVARFAGLSMSGHARQKGAFRGPDSDVFFNMLVDMMAGILEADVSPDTRAALVNRQSSM